MADASILLYTIVCIYFAVKNYFIVSDTAIIYAMSILWSGQLAFGVMIRSGFNMRFSDPSLTHFQMLWSTIFLLYFSYALKEMRDIMLIGYLAILSFGFFRLSVKQFIANALLTLLAYFSIIVYIFINEPLRIHIDKEMLALAVYSVTCIILVYTGSSVSRLRYQYHVNTQELKDALKLNMLLAITDDLTGLYTRSHLMDILDQQKARADREDNDFIILFADLDHFKNINDTYGHSAGDIVLEDFSEIIKASIREVDYASRFGGEEFVIILVNTDMEQTKQVANRIRETLEKHNFNDVAPGLKVTVSIGAAGYHEFKSIQETLQNADKRMYQAKDSGRNTCVFED